MENVIQQNIPPFQPTPVTPVPSSTNWSRIIIFVLIGLVLIVGSVFVGIQIRKSQITKQPPIVEQPTTFPTQAVINPTTILTNEPNPTIDPTSDWKTYNIKELNISFKLPEELVNLGKWETQILSGETGNNICFKLADKISFGVSSVMAGGIGICDNIKFRINSNSFDYSAGRGGVFGDIQGYKKIGANYYVDKASDPIPTELVTEIKNINDLVYLKIIGKNATEGEWRGPIGGTPGDKQIGALINTSNPQYRGIAISMDLTDTLTINLFDQILSTFKFSN